MVDGLWGGTLRRTLSDRSGVGTASSRTIHVCYWRRQPRSHRPFICGSGLACRFRGAGWCHFRFPVRYFGRREWNAPIDALQQGDGETEDAQGGEGSPERYGAGDGADHQKTADEPDRDRRGDMPSNCASGTGISGVEPVYR